MARDGRDKDQPRKPSITIGDFPGLVSNSDAKSIPLGASIHQVNVAASYPAELRVRAGTRLIRFDP